MSKFPSLVGAALSLAAMSSSGCAMLVPTASGTLAVPAGTSAEAVFGCVEGSVNGLHREVSFWSDRVTRRDQRAGIIETGDFENDNVAGFRVRVHFIPDSNDASIRIKGGGAYFKDLGVDEALKDFDVRMRACLSTPE